LRNIKLTFPATPPIHNNIIQGKGEKGDHLVSQSINQSSKRSSYLLPNRRN